jgi:plastocyanin
VVLSLPSAQPSGTELVRLDVAVPSGIYLRFARNPVNVSLDSQEFAIFTLSAAQNIAPGDYKITVVGTSGSLSVNGSFTVRVTQNLIIVNNKVFTPASLTVKVGTTVYWINLDPATNGDDERETDVVFDAGNVQSSVLYPSPVYSSFSYTFTKAGDYYYHSSMQARMNGEIIVTG